VLIIDSASQLLQEKKKCLLMVVKCFHHTAGQIEELWSDEKFKTT